LGIFDQNFSVETQKITRMMQGIKELWILRLFLMTEVGKFIVTLFVFVSSFYSAINIGNK